MIEFFRIWFNKWKGERPVDIHLETGAVGKMFRIQNDGQHPTVLVVHGWRTNIFGSSTHLEMAELANEAGYNCFLLSLRGHPGSSGDISQVTRDDHLADIRAAYQWLLKNPKVDTRRLCGFGTSYGGYLLAALMSELPIVLLGLRAPALYSDDGLTTLTTRALTADDNALWEWRSTIRTTDESCALRGIGNFAGRLFVIIGEKDEQMPAQVAQSYSAAAIQVSALDMEVIPGAPHALRGEFRRQFLEMFNTWFTQHYPSSSSFR